MSPAPPGPGVAGALSATLASARTALSTFLELVVLEARRAGLALAWMLAFGIAMAVCAVAAWLALLAVLALWAVSLGLPVIAAVLAIAGINLLGAGALAFLCIGLSRSLLFGATRRQLAGKAAPPLAAASAAP